MGVNFSRLPLTLFEICNELLTAAGAGIPGMLVLFNHGMKNNKLVGATVVSGITIVSLLFVFSSEEYDDPGLEKIVVVTGCDTGLGFSLAEHCAELGFSVLAGFFNIESEGAKKLLSKRREIGLVKGFELDVTDASSVHRSVKIIQSVLDEDRNNVLWAVINNAGVMVFGEYEWQTERLIQNQIDVNLLGTLRFTHGLCPLLRKYEARLINVSSHCAYCTLPGLAVYGATKAAISGFSDGLRVEMSKYGVKVVTFVPGSFITQSNILSKQTDYAYEMRSAFTKEQEDFYGPYFLKYNTYLSRVPAQKHLKKIDDVGIYSEFEKSLLSKTPKAHYKVEPMRYKIYHALFKISPTVLRDFLVEWFMQMPKYQPSWEDFEISYSVLNKKYDYE